MKHGALEKGPHVNVPSINKRGKIVAKDPKRRYNYSENRKNEEDIKGVPPLRLTLQVNHYNLLE